MDTDCDDETGVAKALGAREIRRGAHRGVKSSSMVGRLRGGALARDRFEILLDHGRRPNPSASRKRRRANADVWYTSAAPNGAARVSTRPGESTDRPTGAHGFMTPMNEPPMMRMNADTTQRGAL